jgi:capsular exopolysaccharide synthesis family protein
MTSKRPETPTLRASASRGLRPEAHLVSLLSPGSFEAEQYRMLRHTIERKHKDANLCLVGVTSPEEGEGKTTTSINLAGSLAQDPGTRVLLIDADLRRPAVAERLGMPRGNPGLAEAILDPTIALVDVVSVDRRYNLTVLPAGRGPNAPYEILKSPALGEFLTQLRQVFDYIIIDLAPVMPCPDPRLVEPWLDGVLFVVGAHKTPRSTVESALNLMDRSKLLGVVFNNDDTASSYGRRYSGYASSYARSGERDK